MTDIVLSVITGGSFILLMSYLKEKSQKKKEWEVEVNYYFDRVERYLRLRRKNNDFFKFDEENNIPLSKLRRRILNSNPLKIIFYENEFHFLVVEIDKGVERKFYLPKGKL